VAAADEVRAVRAHEIHGFYIHLSIYLSVNAGLFFLWVLNGGGTYWPAWALVGWGIGVAIHGITVLVGHWRPAETTVEHEQDRIRSHVSEPSLMH
jgi:hypothetical protein